MTPRPENQPFADWLADAMEKRALSQSDVARQMWGDGEDGGARNRDRIGHYLRRTSYPDPENRQKLADVFGVPLAEVPLKLPGKPTRNARAVMSDEKNVLDYLRAQFARMDTRFDSIERNLDELTMRLGSVERELAGMRGDIAILHHRVDNLDRRIARIERRLELRALEERE